MRCTVILEFDDNEGTPVRRFELMRLHRDVDNSGCGDVGLSLAESKSLMNCVHQQFVVEQLGQFCQKRRRCTDCDRLRPLHDSHCSELKTTLGSVFYCRDRWKACKCGGDKTRYISPLKNYLTEVSTGELRWLHAKLGAEMPYRQALEVIDLMLPTSGRSSHVTLRNHTMKVGASIQHAKPAPRKRHGGVERAELGIDVGYVRRAKNGPKHRSWMPRKDASSFAIVVAAVGAVGPGPRVWASAVPRNAKLHVDMVQFLEDSGYNRTDEVCVLSDGAKDIAALATALPHQSQ